VRVLVVDVQKKFQPMPHALLSPFGHRVAGSGAAAPAVGST
jgi:hypothetical protein